MAQQTADRISALGSRLEAFMAEVRAALTLGNTTEKGGPNPTNSSKGHRSHTAPPGGTPPMLLPTFDGSDALAWLARAEQYFLVSNTPPENRVHVATAALAGPALPWIQLLERRLPNLSWDHFKQDLLERFGDNMKLLLERLNSRQRFNCYPDNTRETMGAEKDRDSYHRPTVHTVKDVEKEIKVSGQAHLPNYNETGPNVFPVIPVEATSYYDLQHGAVEPAPLMHSLAKSSGINVKPTHEDNGASRSLGSQPEAGSNLMLKTNFNAHKSFSETAEARVFGRSCIGAHIGNVVDHMKLPADPGIHPTAVPKKDLPKELFDSHPPYLLERVFDYRQMPHDGEQVDQVLVKWEGQALDEASGA